jgi:diguanylate cyclase (GGDEF)-like protein
MLDNHAIAYLLMPAFVAAVLAQAVNWRVNRDTPGTGWWTIGLSMHAAGTMIRAGLGPEADFVVVPLVMMLLSGGQFVLLFGLCQFAGRPMFAKSAAATIVLVLLGAIYFTYVQDDIVARTALSAAGADVAIGLQIALLPRIARREGIGGVVVLGFAFALTATVLSLRAAGQAYLGPSVIGSLKIGADLSLFGRQAITSVAATLIATAYAYGYIVLVGNRGRWRLQQMATVDALTGIPNRRAFEAELAHAASRVKRNGTRLGLAMFDLDRFKRVNDRFGHEAGDAVLRHFAVTAGGALREIDFFARVGGEEFALLITDATIESLDHAAERIRQALEASPLNLPTGLIGITVSVGAAVSSLGGGDADRLYAAADAALYRAKTLGRNRVERAPAPPDDGLLALGPVEVAR